MKADGLFIYPSMRNFLADGCRVDDCVADMQVIRRWIDALAAAARCVGRQQRGMHVRARTLENIQSDLEVGIEMLYDLLLTPRWAPYRALHAMGLPRAPGAWSARALGTATLPGGSLLSRRQPAQTHHQTQRNTATHQRTTTIHVIPRRLPI